MAALSYAQTPLAPTRAVAMLDTGLLQTDTPALVHYSSGIAVNA